jgi:hypothetical protein
MKNWSKAKFSGKSFTTVATPSGKTVKAPLGMAATPDKMAPRKGK